MCDTKDYLGAYVLHVDLKAKKSNIRKRVPETMLGQSLADDYWDGYYSLGRSDVARFEDHSDRCARVTVISLNDGTEKDGFDIPYLEDSKFSFLADAVSSRGYGKIGLRLSDSLANPDREEMIDTILQNKDYFELLKIKILIESLKTRSIGGFGGRIGNQVLSDTDYEGFYRLSDGKMLFCREMRCWDYESIDRIADGVAVCLALDPANFSLHNSKRMIHPYLDGDMFSDIMEELSKKGMSVVSVIAKKDDELYALLSKALEGDRESASIAGHRLKFNICIPKDPA